METEQRRKEAELRTTEEGSEEQRKIAEKRRRKELEEQAKYRKSSAVRAIEHYRQNNPKKETKLARKGSVLLEGDLKEIKYPDGRIRVEEVYSISKLSAAIGRSRMSLINWINSGALVPPSNLRDMVHGYCHYLRAEVDILVSYLIEYEKEYSYLMYDNPVVKEMNNAVIEFRKSNIPGYTGEELITRPPVK